MSIITEGAEKVTKAKTHLVVKHPFISIIALALLFRCAEEEEMEHFVPTMGTDGKYVYWNAAFVATLTVYEIIGVIAHEVLHVVFLHMFRIGNRDPLRWNRACDYAVNLVVLDMKLQLPADRLFDEKYRNWTVEAIYDDLEKLDKEKEPPFNPPPGYPCPVGPDGPGKSKQPPSQPGKGKGGKPQPSKDGIPEAGEGTGEPSEDQPGKDGGKPKKDLWGTFMPPKNEDGTEPSPSDIQEMVEDIKVRVIRAAEAAKAVGKLPAAFKGLIKAFGKPVVDWHDYIQNWVSGHTPDNYTWRKPNRKMLGLFDMITPSVEFNGAGVGVLSIDQSGSVTDKELVKYATEIVGMIELCKPSKLYIIYHDAVVHRMDTWEAGDNFDSMPVVARGGTRIAPVFKYAAEHIDEQIDWMVCFTDMEINDFPAARDAPDYPVLWAATGNGHGHKFGTYLPIKDALEMKP